MPDASLFLLKVRFSSTQLMNIPLCRKMNIRLVTPLLILLPFGLRAQAFRFSEQKNPFEKANVNPSGKPPLLFQASALVPLPVLPGSKPSTPPPLILLPNWSAETLPFFCKIEHDFGQKNRLPIKFRLGSVEYVDRLEGKKNGGE